MKSQIKFPIFEIRKEYRREEYAIYVTNDGFYYCCICAKNYESYKEIIDFIPKKHFFKTRREAIQYLKSKFDINNNIKTKQISEFIDTIGRYYFRGDDLYCLNNKIDKDN